MSTIVLATQNPGKVAELRSLLGGTGIHVLGLDDIQDTNPESQTDSFPEPEENGQTFLDNATIKAVAYAKATGRPCLADDSGLMIDAIGGWPGVLSSHYAFNGETDGLAGGMSRQQRDDHNIDRVLAELDEFEPEERSARFVCVMVLADASGTVIATSEGKFEGRIGLPVDHPHATPGDCVPRGGNGFGYDPIFLVAPDFIHTSAELDAASKNAVSHRGHAVRDMIGQIKTLDLG